MDRGAWQATGPLESTGSQRVRHDWATEHPDIGNEPKMGGLKSFFFPTLYYMVELGKKGT